MKMCLFSLIIFINSITISLGWGADEIIDGTSFNTHHIRWIQEFSTSSFLNEQPSFSDRLLNFIFGKSSKNLVRPQDIVASSNGHWVITDQGAQSIVVVDKEKNKIRFVGSSDDDGFPSLTGVAFGPKGDVLFTDSKLNQIYFMDEEGGKPQILNDSLKMNRPTGISYSAVSDEIWVSETGAHRLLVLDQNGNFLRTIGRRGEGEGEFNFPTSLWIDGQGIVYIVDAMNFRVQILNDEGQVLSVFGEAGDASGYFARPKGIATDAEGNIYVVDALFHTVQIFDREGNFLSNFGRQGTGEGEFWLPAGICIDDSNYIYVADSYNSRIQVFQVTNGANGEN